VTIWMWADDRQSAKGATGCSQLATEEGRTEQPLGTGRTMGAAQMSHTPRDSKRDDAPLVRHDDPDPHTRSARLTGKSAVRTEG
jgi:hypothetical protein